MTRIGFLIAPIEVPRMALVTREHVRRAIAFFLFTLLAFVCAKRGEAKELVLVLTPIAALLARVVAFYFPRTRM